MSQPTNSMQLRGRRRALGDISNREDSHTNLEGKPDQHTLQPRSKRSRPSLPSGEVEMAVNPPITTEVTTSSSATSNSTTASTASATSAAVAVVLFDDAPVAVAEVHNRPRLFATVMSRNPDPNLCSDIVDEMYRKFYAEEYDLSARPYMARQRDINVKMRSILIDWIVEVHYKFKLQAPTLWLCVNILDRFLEKMNQIPRVKLQLVGVTALLIASKFEEIFPPEIKDCIHITDYAYEKAEVLAMETQILDALEYKIMVPTGLSFLNRYFSIVRASDRTRGLALFYAERNLQESDSLEYRPHQVAAAALYAALRQQESATYVPRTGYLTGSATPTSTLHTCWPMALEAETEMSEAEIVPIARNMIQHVSEEPETASRRRLIAAKKKYAVEKYQYVSSLALPRI